MASRTAAKSDETADNSIGNITGSILAAVLFRCPSRSGIQRPGMWQGRGEGHRLGYKNKKVRYWKDFRET